MFAILQTWMWMERIQDVDVVERIRLQDMSCRSVQRSGSTWLKACSCAAWEAKPERRYGVIIYTMS